jgi:hypothetical protein
MSLFPDDPKRRIREYFTDVNAAGNRFKKTNKPTQESFERLFNSTAFILDRNDRAKEYTTDPDAQTEVGIQGLVVMATDTHAKTRTEPVDINNSLEKLPYTYAIRPVNLPEIVGILPAVDLTPLPQPPVPILTINQDDTVQVTEDNTLPTPNGTGNKNHTIWRLKVSTIFIDWVKSWFTYLKGVIDTHTTQIATLQTDKADVVDLAITDANVALKVDKTNWITQLDPERLRIYDDAPAEVFSVIANYGTPTPTASGSFVYCRYKITDKVCHLYWMITIKAIDFANANLKLYRFNFKITGKQTSSISARSIGYMKGIVYNVQPILPLPPVVPSLEVSPSDEGCIIEAVNNGADIDINMYKYDRFGDVNPDNLNGINSMSSAYDIQLYGQIFFEIV